MNSARAGLLTGTARVVCLYRVDARRSLSPACILYSALMLSPCSKHPPDPRLGQPAGVGFRARVASAWRYRLAHGGGLGTHFAARTAHLAS